MKVYVLVVEEHCLHCTPTYPYNEDNMKGAGDVDRDLLCIEHNANFINFSSEKKLLKAKEKKKKKKKTTKEATREVNMATIHTTLIPNCLKLI